MAIYEFLTPQGGVVCREYPMGKAPKIGATIRVRGQRLKRLPPSWGAGGPDRGIKCVDYGHEAVGMLNKRHYGPQPGVKRYSKDGFPVFSTRQEIREYEARSGLKYDA